MSDKKGRVLISRGVMKSAETSEGLQTLREANNEEAVCCGIFCCDGQSALRLDDRTTKIAHEVFVDNGNLFFRVFDAQGNIVSTTQLN